MKPAARVDDEVKHAGWADAKAEPAALTGGIIIGIGIAVSGGTVALAIGIAGALAAIGKLIDKFLLASGDEKILTGAQTVFTNLKPAAYADPECKVEHGFIITGSRDVYIERSRASRLDDLSTCPGKIVQGAAKPFGTTLEVFIGGPPAAPHAMPTWYKLFLGADIALSVAGLLQSLKDAQGLWNKAQMAFDAADALSTAAELATGDPLIDNKAFDGTSGVKGIIDGLKEVKKL